MRVNQRLFITLLSCTAAGIPSAAYAQADGRADGGGAAVSSAAATEDATNGDIVITARKKTERLQDVPAAVTAFSAEKLRTLGIRDIADLSLQTPGFALQNASRQNEQPFIRGAAVNSVFRQAQNASFFVDGIYVSGIARTISLDDIERVEVVLGPQAVYFGARDLRRRDQLRQPQARTGSGAD